MLPSISDWIESCTGQLLDAGQPLFVQAPPRGGKTYLAKLVEKTLGATALYVDGKFFTEQNQAFQRESLVSAINSRVEAHGYAQLIFDNYHKALRRSQGQQLQQLLVSLLIDGDFARDIGAVFFATCSGPVHLDSRGSPLYARGSSLRMPRIAEKDLVQLSNFDMDFKGWFGDSSILLNRSFHRNQIHLPELISSIQADTRALLDDMPPRVTVAISRGVWPADEVPTVPELEAMCGLILDGNLTEIAKTSGLEAASAQLSSGWPTSETESIDKFVNLLVGHQEVLWFDRYLFADEDVLNQFLARVSLLTNCRILLLGMEFLVSGNSRRTVNIESLRKSSNIEIRFLQHKQKVEFHDRHLVFLDTNSGWAIPTSRVILGLDQPGTAIATKVFAFPVSYRESWDRARTVLD